MRRHRHLLNDLASLLPHSRKDAKLDTKSKLYQLNELAELYNCNNVFFFEARKGKDLYLWMSKAPNGPTVKMHMQNCLSLPCILSNLTNLSKYTPWKNSTSQETVLKAPDPSSPSMPPLTLLPISVSSKSSSSISSVFPKAHEKQNLSSTT